MTFLEWLTGGSKSNATAKGYSLHVGLNAVDPKGYGGWDGKLRACENDAIDMQTYFAHRGYETQLKLTKNCKAADVLGAISHYATICQPGDIFVFTNSSHGGQMPDFDGDEVDGADETICMYDREIIDDELEAAWAKFKPGARVFMISDSCHSGTVMRSVPSDMEWTGIRAQPSTVKANILADAGLRSQYKTIAESVAKRGKISAFTLSFGGCQDNQFSLDGVHNGAFTDALLHELRLNGTENFGRVITRVRHAMPTSQTPSYVYGGPRCQAWERAPAFAVRY